MTSTPPPLARVGTNIDPMTNRIVKIKNLPGMMLPRVCGSAGLPFGRRLAG